MEVEIRYPNRYGSLSNSLLESFERELETKLPAEYRAFLRKYNGGVPYPACFLAPEDPFEVSTTEWTEREVVCFFAMHQNVWRDDTMEGSMAFPIQEAWRDLKRELPGNPFLPIGKDWSGNYICLGYEGEERGRIFFYDHEYEVATLIAEGFQAFWENLRPCEQQG